MFKELFVLAVLDGVVVRRAFAFAVLEEVVVQILNEQQHATGILLAFLVFSRFLRSLTLLHSLLSRQAGHQEVIDLFICLPEDSFLIKV